LGWIFSDFRLKILAQARPIHWSVQMLNEPLSGSLWALQMNSLTNFR
jgi:hypothetical protein